MFTISTTIRALVSKQSGTLVGSSLTFFVFYLSKHYHHRVRIPTRVESEGWAGGFIGRHSVFTNDSFLNIVY